MSFFTGAGAAACAASSRSIHSRPGAAALGSVLVTPHSTGRMRRRKCVKPCSSGSSSRADEISQPSSRACAAYLALLATGKVQRPPQSPAPGLRSSRTCWWCSSSSQVAFLSGTALLGRGAGSACARFSRRATPHRANIATRLPYADGRAEIHQRLRIDANVVLGKQAFCEPPQLRFDFTLAWPAFDAVAAREHALDVAVKNRGAAAEGERRDRRGGRAPDAGNLLGLVCRIRESAAVFGNDFSSGPMQVARAGVVAEAAPEPQHLVLVRRSERLQVGKAGQEALVVGNDRRHLRLLQHHFGEPDAVGIPRALPGKSLAPVTALPGDEKACESGHARILMGAWATPSSTSANTIPS